MDCICVCCIYCMEEEKKRFIHAYLKSEHKNEQYFILNILRGIFNHTHYTLVYKCIIIIETITELTHYSYLHN